MIKKEITHATVGILLFIGSLQWFVCSTITETIMVGKLPNIPDNNVQISILYPYVSSISLSVMIHAISMLLLGAGILISAVILYDTYRFMLFSFLFSVSGISMAGLGLLVNSTEVSQTLQRLWFLSLALSAIAGFFMLKKPVSYCSLIIGLFWLVTLAVPVIGGSPSPFYLLKTEGVQKALDYSQVLWIGVLSGYFMALPETFTLPRRNRSGK